VTQLIKKRRLASAFLLFSFLLYSERPSLAAAATITAATITAAAATLCWTFVKFLTALAGNTTILTTAPAPSITLRTGNMRTAHMLIRGTRLVAGRQRDLELDDLIPLGIGALSLWNRKQRLQTLSRGFRLLSLGMLPSGLLPFGMRFIRLWIVRL
jgi:hypothetical protein